MPFKVKIWKSKGFLFGAIVFLFSQVYDAAAMGPLHENSWLTHVIGSLDNGVLALKEHGEMLSLIESCMDIPYIMTLDSEDESVIKITSSLVAAAAALKIFQLLVTPPDPIPLLTAKTLIWDAPKLGCYLLSIFYDVIRFMDAPRVACINKAYGNRLSGLKINQVMQLAVEIVLRLVVLLNDNTEKHKGSQAATICASGLADIVCIWRRLSRYITYFMYTETMEFKMSLHRKVLPEFDTTRKLEAQEDIDLLTEYADNIFEKQQAASNSKPVATPALSPKNLLSIEQEEK